MMSRFKLFRSTLSSAGLKLWFCFAIGAILPAAAQSSAVPSANAEPAELVAAVEAARAAATPYRLWIDCTDEAHGARNLELFESGVAIWGNRAQLNLDAEARAALLSLILDLDFASIGPLYGGLKKKMKGPVQESEQPSVKAPPEGGQNLAPRVACRIDLRLSGLRKTSIQMADGEQSKELWALATAVLDHVAPIAKAQGITVSSLDDGLAKLADGVLAPEALELRFVELSATGKGKGAILQAIDGAVAVRTYAPGHEIGDVEPVALTGSGFVDFMQALRVADPVSLPVNLWSTKLLELDIGVLGYRKEVVARPFGRMTSETHGEAQKRFDGLIKVLRELRAGLGAS